MSKFAKWLRKAMARYVILDNFGTRQYCWTEQEALDWLPYCANWATIQDRAEFRVVATRYY